MIQLNTNAVALKLFNFIANEWQISTEQSRKFFLFLENKQVEGWKSDNLNTEQPDLLLFVSHLMAIYQLLHQIFPDPDQANAWMSKPSKEFQHHSCLDVISQDGLKGTLAVQSYLESQFT